MPNLPLPEGITNYSDLMYVMLDIAPLDIERAMGDAWNESELFYGDVKELRYAQGAVAETQAHLTLAGGLHPTESYEEDVLTALIEWDFPQILIDHVGTFPSRVEGQDYVTVVAHVVPSRGLVMGNRILQQFPYSYDYDFKPHVTLAYVKGDANVKEWVDRLNSAFGHTIHEVTGLNLGLDD